MVSVSVTHTSFYNANAYSFQFLKIFKEIKLSVFMPLHCDPANKSKNKIPLKLNLFRVKGLTINYSRELYCKTRDVTSLT